MTKDQQIENLREALQELYALAKEEWDHFSNIPCAGSKALQKAESALAESNVECNAVELKFYESMCKKQADLDAAIESLTKFKSDYSNLFRSYVAHRKCVISALAERDALRKLVGEKGDQS